VLQKIAGLTKQIEPQFAEFLSEGEEYIQND